MTNTSRTYELLAAFLYALEAEGYRMGTGTHLQLQELLQRLPDDPADEVLRDSIIPLLATNEQEQELFRTLFRRAQNQLASKHEAYRAPAAGKSSWSIWQILFFTLLAAILAVIGYLGRSILDPRLEPVVQHLTLEPGDVSEAIAPDSSALEGLSAPVVFQLPQKKEAVLPRFLQFELVDEGGRVQFVAPDTAITDTLELVLRGEGRRFRTIYLIATVEATLETGEEVPEVQAQLDTPIVSTDPLEPVAPVFRPRELPYASDIRSLEYTQPTGFSAFLARNIGWLRWVVIFLGAQLVMLWARWREERRRKLVTTPEERTNPPYVWIIELPDLAGAISLGDGIQRVLTRLRRRAYDEREKLDMPATIRATVRRGGMVDFQYQPLTRPPEYVLLIDRQSGRSHRAALFDYLFSAFRQQDVLVERFFFQGDIRACTNELHPEGIGLRELHHRYPGARLLIIGDGYRLLNARTGKVNTWASRLLGNWKEYALLTPRPPGAWGRRERLLRQQLPVVPATLQSLTFLLEQWSAKDEADFDQWSAYVQDVQREPIVLEGDLMSTLEKHYDPAMLQWIAGCAIYPELHWDLTLLIGRTLSRPERSLLTLDSVQGLLRLPWYSEGKMPEAARLVLLDWLQSAYPETETRLREVIHEQFQKMEPPADSVAYEPYRLQMAFNEWRITRDRKRKQELEREMEQLLDQGQEADMVMVRYLEGEPGPLDLVLPDRFKKYVYKGGYRELGSRESQRDLRWASMLWLALSIGSFWVNPQVDDCGGQTRSYLVPTITRAVDSVELPNYSNSRYELLGVSQLDSSLILGSGQEIVRYYLPNDVVTPLGMPNRAVQAMAFPAVGTNGGNGPVQYAMLIIQDGQLIGLSSDGQGGFQSTTLSGAGTVRDVSNYTSRMIPLAYEDGRLVVRNESGIESMIANHPGIEHVASPYFFANRFASAASDSSLVFWEPGQRSVGGAQVATLEETQRIQLPYQAEELLMSWDGKFVATAGAGDIDVWTTDGGLVYTSRGSDLIGISGNSVFFRQAGNVYARKFPNNQTVTQFDPSGTEYLFGRGYNQLFALNPAGTHILRWGTTSDAFDEIEICLATAADTALYREHRARQFAFHGQFDALDAEVFQLDSASISDSLRRARTANIATVLYNRALLALEHADTALACELIDRAIGVDGSRTPIYLRAREIFCAEEEESDQVVTTITGELRNIRTGDPVAGALVTAETGSVVTNSSGRFRLELRGSFTGAVTTLVFSAPGFPDKTYEVSDLETGATIDIGSLPWASLPEGAELEIRAKGDQFGLWQDGSWVLEPKYTEIERDGRTGYFRLSGTTDDGERRVGMANPQGQVVVPLEYRAIQFPSAGLIGAQSPTTFLWGYLSAGTGDRVIQFGFDEVQPFDDVVASVTSSGSSFLIDRDGLCIEDCPDDYLQSVIEAYLQGNYGDMSSLRTHLLNHPQLDRMLTLAMNDDFLGDFDQIPETLDEDQRLALDRLEELFYQSSGLDAPTVAKYQELFRLMRNAGKVQDMSGELPPPIADILPEMVEVPGGTFVMGCVDGRDTPCEDNELPPHQVTLSGFAMSKYEITNRQYATFLNMASNVPDDLSAWYQIGDRVNARIEKNGDRYIVQAGFENHPVTLVSWTGARAFARWLSQETGNTYRLPTEAEWEYAARGGEKGATEQFKFSGSNNLNEVGWWSENSKLSTHPVGQKQPNLLGLYDMSGNVWEWCSDLYGLYQQGSSQNPIGATESQFRVNRGGGWESVDDYCRMAFRNTTYPSQTGTHLGFRLVRSPM